jgi:hypothetical protein
MSQPTPAPRHEIPGGTPPAWEFIGHKGQNDVYVVLDGDKRGQMIGVRPDGLVVELPRG